MIWAYLSFSQFMIIWSENLPEETPWYLNRIHGGWQWIALALVLLQFAVPFLLLLSREAKMNARSLTWIAALVLAMRFIDVVWWVEAAYGEPVSLYLLMDVAALLAIGGIWTWFFARRLRRNPLLPIADPYLDRIPAGGGDMSRRPRAVDVPSGSIHLHHEGPAIDISRTLFSAAVVIATVVLSCIASRAIYS